MRVLGSSCQVRENRRDKGLVAGKASMTGTRSETGRVAGRRAWLFFEVKEEALNLTMGSHCSTLLF